MVLFYYWSVAVVLQSCSIAFSIVPSMLISEVLCTAVLICSCPAVGDIIREMLFRMIVRHCANGRYVGRCVRFEELVSLAMIFGTVFGMLLD